MIKTNKHAAYGTTISGIRYLFYKQVITIKHPSLWEGLVRLFIQPR